MRCLACNANLSDRDSTRKGLHSGEYLDLCEYCISQTPDLMYEENPALSNKVPDEEVFPETDDDVLEETA